MGGTSPKEKEKVKGKEKKRNRTLSRRAVASDSVPDWPARRAPLGVGPSVIFRCALSPNRNLSETSVDIAIYS